MRQRYLFPENNGDTDTWSTNGKSPCCPTCLVYPVVSQKAWDSVWTGQPHLTTICLPPWICQLFQKIYQNINILKSQTFQYDLPLWQGGEKFEMAVITHKRDKTNTLLPNSQQSNLFSFFIPNIVKSQPNKRVAECLGRIASAAPSSQKYPVG